MGRQPAFNNHDGIGDPQRRLNLSASASHAAADSF
jgi:hypothetical protein